jgi:hypothetical protein
MNNILFTGLLIITALGPLPDIAVTQTVTPTATITATATITDDWSFPTGPLLPYTYTIGSRPQITWDINRDIMWNIGRVALTSYNIISGGNNYIWGVFAMILLIPTAGIMIYRLLTRPPDI